MTRSLIRVARDDSRASSLKQIFFKPPDQSPMLINVSYSNGMMVVIYLACRTLEIPFDLDSNSPSFVSRCLPTSYVISTESRMLSPSPVGFPTLVTVGLPGRVIPGMTQCILQKLPCL